VYGIIRRFSEYDFFPCFALKKDWDQVVVQAIIWILQLSAAATQTAFVNDYFHCGVDCDYLNRGSHSRNVAYAVFAWLLWYVEFLTAVPFTKAASIKIRPTL
jgi:hypothetical protein